MSFEPGTLAIRQKAVNELMECTLQELFTQRRLLVVGGV
jgi:hypothetical protein